MTGRGGPTTRVDDNDSTPHHRCEQLLAGWIWGAEEATRWGADSQRDTMGGAPPQHGKEGHDRAPPAFPRVAVYFVFFSFIVIFVIVQRSIYHSIKEYIYLLNTITSLKTEEILPI
jgi:hypothetical protein